MKWSRPHFLHKGLLCGMSAFKHHCAFGFWLGEMCLAKKASGPRTARAWGTFGKIASLKDLPSDKEMLAYIKKAVALNESGAKRPAPTRTAGSKELIVPDYVVAALRKNSKARAAFEAFSYSHKKEYVEWITEAKREETPRIALRPCWPGWRRQIQELEIRQLLGTTALYCNLKGMSARTHKARPDLGPFVVV